MGRGRRGGEGKVHIRKGVHHKYLGKGHQDP